MLRIGCRSILNYVQFSTAIGTLNFVSQFRRPRRPPASPTHELAGPYTKFCETYSGLSKEEAHTDAIGTTSVIAFLSRDGV